MKENIFKLDGITYRVKKSGGYCDGCAFVRDEDSCMCVPPCIGKYRKDGRTVIFVAQKPTKAKPKPKPKPKEKEKLHEKIT